MKRMVWIVVALMAMSLPLAQSGAGDVPQVPAAIKKPAPPAPAAVDPVVPFERYKLENGIEVILHQDNTVPLVAVDVWYHVGSGDETPGKSGFAHLFEHMLFQGSKHVGEDKHFDILTKIGKSTVNGSTSTDRTNYYEVVPSHQLETALWLESDRMGYFLPLVTKKSLDNQIEVVRNERRQRVDNQPYGKTSFVVSGALYPEGHPYRYQVIGRHEDLESASLEDVVGFYRKWYVPANSTLLIAGDFEIAAAKKLVAKWFGTFPKTQKPAHQQPAMPQISKSRHTVEDELAKLERIEYHWHSPGFFAPGDAELDVLAEALGSSTGRLYKRLVVDEKLAQAVRVFQDSQQISSVFTVMVTLKSGADLAKVEAIMNEEIDRIRKEPVSKSEFNRTVVGREASMIWGLEALMSRAELLHRYNHFVGTPDYISQDLDRYRKTTPEAVRDIASRYLDPGRRVEVLTVPKKESK